MPLKESDLQNKTAAQRRALKLEHYLDDLPKRLPFQWVYTHPDRGNIGVMVTGVGYRDDMLRLDIAAALANGKRLAVASPMYILNPPMRARTGASTVDGEGQRLYTTAWNPLEAIRQDIQHTIGLMPALLNGQVVSDLDPTLTVYPDADAESATVDGYVERSSVDQTFANIRSGAGVLHGDADSTAIRIAWISASTTSNQFSRLRRAIYLFDTSTIPSDATVDSATISIWGTATQNGLGSPALHIVDSNPASNTDLVNGDYSNVGTTSYGSIALASYSTSGYNDITLGTSGITKAGITKLGARLSWDQSGTFGGTWSSGQHSSFYGYFADASGTSNDPKLVVVYTLASARRVMLIS